MKISWLNCFLAVEKYRSFSQAADSMFLSQSALSKQVHALEAELGQSLFHRSSHSVTLTQAGEKLVLHARWIVGEYNRLLHSLSDLKALSNQKLTICVPFDMSHYNIAQMIIDFELANPKVIAETHESSSEDMFYALERQDVDFCIGYLELFPKLDSQVIYPLYWDSIVAVLSRSHPLAEEPTFSFGNTANCMYCLPREEPMFFNLFQSMCNEADFSPRLTLSDVRISTIKQYVQRGMRITMTSKLRAANVFSEPEFLHLPITGAPTLTLCLVTRNERLHTFHENFIAHAQKYFLTLQHSTAPSPEKST